MLKRKTPEDSTKEPRSADKALEAFFKVKKPSPVYRFFEKPYIGPNPKNAEEVGIIFKCIRYEDNDVNTI